MHVVPPPMTGNYMPSGPDVEIDYSQFTYGPNQSQPSESETQTNDFDTCESYCSVETHESLHEPIVNEPKVVNQPKVRSDAPIIEEYESDNEDEHVPQPTKEHEQHSFAITKKQVKTPRKHITSMEAQLLLEEVKVNITGKEFKNRDFIEFYGSKGIKREYSNARTPQQNEVAERKNMTLIKAARTMLADSFLPNTFWAKAISNSEKEAESAQDYFVLTIWSSYSSTVKRSTTKDTREAPNKHPDLKTVEKPVAKEDQVFLDELERLKRQEQDVNDAAEALRKEFAQETKDLLLQAGAAKTSSTNIVNTASTSVSTASPYGGLSFTDLTNPNQDDSEIPVLEEIYDNSTDGIFNNSSYDDEGALADFTNLEHVVNVSPIPTSRINSIHPSTLIRGDLQSAVQTRSKVTKSFGAYAFICLMGRRQLEQNGFIEIRKMREDLWLEIRQGFIDPKYPKKVYKVVKALYGLHQAPRAWYATLSTFLLKNGYRRGTIDKTLFIKKDKHDIILVQVYVDDIIFGSTKKSWCDEFEALMKSRF
ncbi:putative ribonuclease H-like domain-containing protein [Tanacetum coccineum]